MRPLGHQGARCQEHLSVDCAQHYSNLVICFKKCPYRPSCRTHSNHVLSISGLPGDAVFGHTLKLLKKRVERQ